MTKFKDIFNDDLKNGTPVISLATDETFIYIQEYEPGLTSLVKVPYKNAAPFLIQTRLIKKFRLMIFFDYISEQASILNKKLGRLVNGKV